MLRDACLWRSMLHRRCMRHVRSRAWFSAYADGRRPVVLCDRPARAARSAALHGCRRRPAHGDRRCGCARVRGCARARAELTKRRIVIGGGGLGVRLRGGKGGRACSADGRGEVVLACVRACVDGFWLLAGIPASFAIHTFDRNGNPIRTGGALIGVCGLIGRHAEEQPAEVVDKGDGRCCSDVRLRARACVPRTAVQLRRHVYAAHRRTAAVRRVPRPTADSRLALPADRARRGRRRVLCRDGLPVTLPPSLAYCR